MNVSELDALLSKEISVINKLIELFQQEHQILSSNELDKLEALSRRKLKTLQALENAEHERGNWLQAAGWDRGGNAMVQLLSLQAPGSKADSAWRELLKLASDAKALNQRNGALVQSKMNLNEQYLQILVNAGNRLAVYGADGKTLTPTGSRPLAKG
jgi:flagellar biosynthesis protein FlgN